jgi:hypothetical protein
MESPIFCRAATVNIFLPLALDSLHIVKMKVLALLHQQRGEKFSLCELIAFLWRGVGGCVCM